jgi:hypothetical protein
MQTEYDDPHDKIAKRVDDIDTDTQPPIKKPVYMTPELLKVEKNLRFTDKMRKKPLKKDEHTKTIFGCIPVDPTIQVYGDNHWDRGIYIVDELCDIYVSATLEQQQKYLRKKRKMDSKMLFILLLMGFGGLAIIFMLFLMGAIQ